MTQILLTQNCFRLFPSVSEQNSASLTQKRDPWSPDATNFQIDAERPVALGRSGCGTAVKVRGRPPAATSGRPPCPPCPPCPQSEEKEAAARRRAMSEGQLSVEMAAQESAAKREMAQQQVLLQQQVRSE